MKGLALFQKVNHFPGMFNIYRKNHLATHLEKMRRSYPEHFTFYPKTLQLPNDYSELVTSIKGGGDKVYIGKPCDQCQGKGIFLITCINDIPIKDKLVIQDYVNR